MEILCFVLFCHRKKTMIRLKSAIRNIAVHWIRDHQTLLPGIFNSIICNQAGTLPMIHLLNTGKHFVYSSLHTMAE